MPTFRLTQTLVVLEKRVFVTDAESEAEARARVDAGKVQGAPLGQRVVVRGELEVEEVGEP